MTQGNFLFTSESVTEISATLGLTSEKYIKVV